MLNFVIKCNRSSLNVNQIYERDYKRSSIFGWSFLFVKKKLIVMISLILLYKLELVKLKLLLPQTGLPFQYEYRAHNQIA